MHKSFATRTAALACSLGLGLTALVPPPALAAGGQTGLWIQGSSNDEDLITPQGADVDDPQGTEDNFRVTIPVAIRYVAKADGTLVGPANRSVSFSNNSSMDVHISGLEVEDANPSVGRISDQPGIDAAQLYLTPVSFSDHKGTEHRGRTINLAHYKDGASDPARGDWNILRSDADETRVPARKVVVADNDPDHVGLFKATYADGSSTYFEAADPSLAYAEGETPRKYTVDPTVADPTVRKMDTENKLYLEGSASSDALDGSIKAFDKLDPLSEIQLGTIHWTVSPGLAQSSARLVNGPSFASALREVAGGSDNVRALEFRCVTDTPGGVLVSTGEGPAVTLSFDDATGTAYVDTVADGLTAPQNGSGMFAGLTGLESVVLDRGSKTLLARPSDFSDLADAAAVTAQDSARVSLSFEVESDESVPQKSYVAGLWTTLPGAGPSSSGATFKAWEDAEGGLHQAGERVSPGEPTTYSATYVTLPDAPLKAHLSEYSVDELKLVSARLEAAQAQGVLEHDAVYQLFHQFLLADERWLSDEVQGGVVKGNAASENRYEFRIVGILHDDKAQGGGKVGLTLGLTSAVQSATATEEDTRYKHPWRFTNAGPRNETNDGWAGSNLRAVMNSGEIWESIPVSLRSKIVEVDKRTNNVGAGSGNPDDVSATSDKVWTHSVVELYGDITAWADFGLATDPSLHKLYNGAKAVFPLEGEQYEFYRDVWKVNARDGVSSWGPDGTFQGFWTRSQGPGISNAVVFQALATYGSRAGDPATTAMSDRAIATVFYVCL